MSSFLNWGDGDRSLGAGPLSVDPGPLPPPPPPALWQPTKAFGRAVLITGVLLVVAAVLGRFDLVVLAAPVALGAAFALTRRPTVAPTLEVAVGETVAVEGAPVEVRLGAGNPERAAYDLMLIRLRTPTWVRLRHGDRPYIAGTRPGMVVDIDLAGVARRWGRHAVGPVTAHALACDGLLVSAPVVADPLLLDVYPQTDRFAADEAMPRAAGLVGAHRSRRPGEGGELAGVRAFGPGDRLRRIDWRVSLRTRELHVAATLSDRDAEVLLLLDVLHEAGRSGGVGGAASVLDTTVRAAAGIAEHYLTRGDRVAMLEYGYRARWLRPASGRRQYMMVLQWLLDTTPSDSPYEPGAGLFGTHLIPSHALVIVLSPLLDPRTGAMLARLTRSGRYVIAVDTLGATDVRLPAAAYIDVARRLWALERANLVGQLREHGVPVVEWAGAGSLDEVLRDVSRLATGPRVGVR
jgi:uncharacterized protein (DUF58 family)